MNTDAEIKEIAYKLRRYRELHNITREEFCEKTNQNVEYWGTIERGERNISLNKLIEVCRAYNIDAAELIDGLSTDEDNTCEIRTITDRLGDYNAKQLALLIKFMDEILPNV